MLGREGHPEPRKGVVAPRGVPAAARAPVCGPWGGGGQGRRRPWQRTGSSLQGAPDLTPQPRPAPAEDRRQPPASLRSSHLPDCPRPSAGHPAPAIPVNLGRDPLSVQSMLGLLWGRVCCSRWTREGERNQPFLPLPRSLPSTSIFPSHPLPDYPSLPTQHPLTGPLPELRDWQ